MVELNEILKGFEPISLAQMDEVALLNRTDTKFILSRTDLFDILKEIAPKYRILEIKEKRFARYKTLYYDTPQFDYFTQHQNGKKNRYKIRFREYLDSNLAFLEIKFKSNKGRTVKSRIKVEGIETQLSKSSTKFAVKTIKKQEDWEPKLWNSFTRLTLVSREDKERATIDLNLGFEFDGKTDNLSDLVIAEIKQEKASRNSVIIQALKKRMIRSERISKYCLGCVLLYPALKYNNFKGKLLKIEKLNNHN